MSNIFATYLVPIAIGAVAIVLVLGLVNMMRGGSPNTSQKLMRLRVLLQFVAIIVIMAAIWAMKAERMIPKWAPVFDQIVQRIDMVVLNRIYTRTGDDGTTALGSGARRKKYDLRVDAYGTLDEVNAVIGLVRLHTAGDPALDEALGRIQNDLFDVEADLCLSEKGPGGARLTVTDAQVDWLEERDRPAQCRSRAAAILHPAGRQRRPRPICIWRARSAAAPSASWSR